MYAIIKNNQKLVGSYLRNAFSFVYILKYVFKLFVKKWWLLSLSSLVFGFVFLLYITQLMTPTYTSSGLVYIDNKYISNKANTYINKYKDVNLGELIASRKLAETSIQILTSDTFIEQVMNATNVGMDVDKIRNSMSIKIKNETQILEIRFKSSKPEVATLLVETILKLSNDEIQRVIRGGSAVIIDEASYPTGPIGVNRLRIFLSGMFWGVLFTAFPILIIDLFDKRIKDQNDLSSRYEYPIIGLIPSIRSSSEKY